MDELPTLLKLDKATEHINRADEVANINSSATMAKPSPILRNYFSLEEINQMTTSSNNINNNNDHQPSGPSPNLLKMASVPGGGQGSSGHNLSGSPPGSTSSLHRRRNSTGSIVHGYDSPCQKIELGRHRQASGPNNSHNFINAKIRQGKKGPVPKLTGQEMCIICGDKSTGFNYGVLSCEGCKAFYRRSITHANKTSVYTCQKNNNCDMFTSGRRKCQACRYRKCVESGMRDLGRFTQSQEFRANKEKYKKQQADEIQNNFKNVQALKNESNATNTAIGYPSFAEHQSFQKKSSHEMSKNSTNLNNAVQQSLELILTSPKTNNTNNILNKGNNNNNHNSLSRKNIAADGLVESHSMEYQKSNDLPEEIQTNEFGCMQGNVSMIDKTVGVCLDGTSKLIGEGQQRNFVLTENDENLPTPNIRPRKRVNFNPILENTKTISQNPSIVTTIKSRNSNFLDNSTIISPSGYKLVTEDDKLLYNTVNNDPNKINIDKSGINGIIINDDIDEEMENEIRLDTISPMARDPTTLDPELFQKELENASNLSTISIQNQRIPVKKPILRVLAACKDQAKILKRIELDRMDHSYFNTFDITDDYGSTLEDDIKNYNRIQFEKMRMELIQGRENSKGSVNVVDSKVILSIDEAALDQKLDKESNNQAPKNSNNNNQNDDMTEEEKNISALIEHNLENLDFYVNLIEDQEERQKITKNICIVLEKRINNRNQLISKIVGKYSENHNLNSSKEPIVDLNSRVKLHFDYEKPPPIYDLPVAIMTKTLPMKRAADSKIPKERSKSMAEKLRVLEKGVRPIFRSANQNITSITNITLKNNKSSKQTKQSKKNEISDIKKYVTSWDSNQASNTVGAGRRKTIPLWNPKKDNDREKQAKNSKKLLKESKSDIDADDEDEEIGQNTDPGKASRALISSPRPPFLEQIWEKKAKTTGVEPSDSLHPLPPVVEEKNSSEEKQDSWSTKGTFIYTQYTKEEQWVLHKKMLEQLDPSMAVIFGAKNSKKKDKKILKTPQDPNAPSGSGSGPSSFGSENTNSSENFINIDGTDSSYLSIDSSEGKITSLRNSNERDQERSSGQSGGSKDSAKNQSSSLVNTGTGSSKSSLNKNSKSGSGSKLGSGSNERSSGLGNSFKTKNSLGSVPNNVKKIQIQVEKKLVAKDKKLQDGKIEKNQAKNSEMNDD